MTASPGSHPPAVNSAYPTLLAPGEYHALLGTSPGWTVEEGTEVAGLR